MPTSLDFVLHFAHRRLEPQEAQAMVFKALPWLYYVALNYELSRTMKPSAIALAALSHALQDGKGSCDAFPEGLEEDSHEIRDDILKSLTVILDNPDLVEQILFHADYLLHFLNEQIPLSKDIFGRKVNNKKKTPVTSGAWPFPARRNPLFSQ